MRIRSWDCHPDFPYTNDSSFRGCWEYELREGENTPSHQHEDGQEINIALEGAGKITVGQVTREIHPGAVVFVPPRTNHFIENPFHETLRGITIESSVEFGCVDREGNRVTMSDLDEIIRSIPPHLDEPQSLQLIIRLFDLAGYLSEQIESAIGLDCNAGLDTIRSIEKKVMEAVVKICHVYHGDASAGEGPSSLFHRRFDPHDS